MISPSQLSGWAGNILTALADTTTPTGTVVLWLQSNLPKLNLAIETEFSLTSSGYIDPDMSTNQSGVYEEMYYCDFLRKRASSLLGGSDFKDVVEFAGDEQGRVRWVSFTERAKTYRTLADDCKKSLTDLINWYLETQSTSSCYQILFNLRDDPSGYGLKDYTPPNSYYRPYNTAWAPTTPY